MDRLRTLWEFLGTSFWFVPSLMALVAIALTLLTVSAERSITSLGRETPWFFYIGGPEDARSVLTTLLSSMITMASLVFSITMVVLTLAANQFGPRLIRSFMANPQTQFVLGTFVMTIVYCLLMLVAMEMRDTSERLPYVSVSIAAGLTILSVALLVFYLHSLARSIVSETVIDRVGDELDQLIENLDPLDIGDESEAAGGQMLPRDFQQRAEHFGSAKPGYVQMISFDRLLPIAQKADVLIVLYFRAGHYVVPGAREIGVYPRKRLNDEIKVEIQDAILVGTHRTPVQDPDFSIRHLDEIAVRALSPSLNDPYTAVSVIDRLSASLSLLMCRALPGAVTRDSQGVVRILCTEVTYGGLIGESFNQIRQHGACLPIIILHLLEAIERIAQHVLLPAQHSALEEQARVIMEASRRSIEEPFDMRKIEQRYDRAQRTLDQAALRWRPGAQAGNKTHYVARTESPVERR